MSDLDPTLAWAFDRMQRLVTRDEGPCFPVTYAEAQDMDDATRAFVTELPAHGIDDGDLPTFHERLEGYLARHVASSRHPTFHNQLFTSVLDPGMAGYLTGVHEHVTLATRDVAPFACAIEDAVAGWLNRHVGWDHGGATATPAGSFSNYLAVYLARRQASNRHGPECLHRLAIFVSESAHYSTDKGAEMAGIPRDQVFDVPTDEHDRMDTDALRAAIAKARADGLIPCMVVSTLGLTVSGALDRTDRIADVIDEMCAGEDDQDGERPSIWLHVDAAWGGIGLLSSEADRFRKGLTRARSLTFDAHKSCMSPMALSFLLVDDPDVLLPLMPRKGGKYLYRKRDGRDLGLTSLYCGKPFLALGMWLAWKVLGVEGIRAHADRAMDLTRLFAGKIADHPHFELHGEPETPVCCFRLRRREGESHGEHEARQDDLRERIIASGKWMVRLCPIGDDLVFRAIFTNPRSGPDDVEQWLAHLSACAADQESETR